jgi:hypothetical protein
MIGNLNNLSYKESEIIVGEGISIHALFLNQKSKEKLIFISDNRIINICETKNYIIYLLCYCDWLTRTY